jgi:hypothetical protein
LKVKVEVNTVNKKKKMKHFFVWIMHRYGIWNDISSELTSFWEIGYRPLHWAYLVEVLVGMFNWENFLQTSEKK